MSVLLRSKEGDEIAKHYGPYLEWKDISKLSPSTVLDILCNDGLHYHVDIKELDKKTGFGKLHFCKWSKKYDYTGQLKDLYLAQKDVYSKLNNLSEKNNYADVVNISPNSNASQSKKREKSNKVRTKFPAETKYPDDFLGPPKSSTARNKRNSYNDIEVNSKQLKDNNDNNNDNNNDDENNSDNDESEEIDETEVVEKAIEVEEVKVASDIAIKQETGLISTKRKKVENSALVQFAGLNESRTGRTIKRSHHFDEVQTIDAIKPKRKRASGPQAKFEELVHEDTASIKRKKVTSNTVINSTSDISATPFVTTTLTPEELEKKNRETILHSFVSSCATSTNIRDLTKAISCLDRGRDIFSSLGLNVDQLKSLLTARKSIDQTLVRLLEHNNLLKATS